MATCPRQCPWATPSAVAVLLDACGCCSRAGGEALRQLCGLTVLGLGRGKNVFAWMHRSTALRWSLAPSLPLPQLSCAFIRLLWVAGVTVSRALHLACKMCSACVCMCVCACLCASACVRMFVCVNSSTEAALPSNGLWHSVWSLAPEALRCNQHGLR